MAGANRDYLSRSLQALWHPCTQMKSHETVPLVPVARGRGVWLYDFDGNRYLDAVSSWWVNLFGHCNPRINAALRDQLETLEHAILAGFTHRPVIELSERLGRLAPGALGHCFYGSDGASAVEIALKMSFHYWRNSGRPEKTGFVSLQNSYHGETLGALSVTDVALFKDTYAPLLRHTVQVPTPDWRYAEPGESPEAYALRCADALEAYLAEHGDETSALIVEPLVQCAAGMGIYHPAYLRRAREMCDRYQVHLIADEIAVGFGRTGTLFAWEQAMAQGPQSRAGSPEAAPSARTGAAPTESERAASCRTGTLFAWEQAMAQGPQSRAGSPEAAPSARTGAGGPDFLCLSKGLSGGYLPLSAVMTTDTVYQAFYHEDVGRGFLHSHSYTGNALACRAALATLDIFEQDGVIEANRAKAVYLNRALEPLAAHPKVKNLRHIGMIWAFEVDSADASLGGRIYREALGRELLLRPIGNTVYFMPPYVIEEPELDLLAARTLEIVEGLNCE